MRLRLLIRQEQKRGVKPHVALRRTSQRPPWQRDSVPTCGKFSYPAGVFERERLRMIDEESVQRFFFWRARARVSPGNCTTPIFAGCFDY